MQSRILDTRAKNAAYNVLLKFNSLQPAVEILPTICTVTIKLPSKVTTVAYQDILTMLRNTLQVLWRL